VTIPQDSRPLPTRHLARDLLRDTAHDTGRTGGAGAAGAEALPAWDLGDLYAGPDDPRLAADLDRAETEAKAFQSAHAGRVPGLSGDALAAAIATYERSRRSSAAPCPMRSSSSRPMRRIPRTGVSTRRCRNG
jgi:hypothetical protein